MSSEAQFLMTSHSIDGTFENCPRRFEFLHFYMRAPEKESDAWAADVGTAVHEATQMWARRVFEGKSHEQAKAEAQFTLLKWWPWEIEARRRATSLPTGIRTLGNALVLLDNVIESDFWNEWELVEIEGFGPAIEVPWRIIHKSLGQVTTPYGQKVFIATQGKIDFIMRHKRLGIYRVVDLKTTEKSRPAHEGAFRFSGQAGQYGMVLDHALGLDWKKQGVTVTYLMAMFEESSEIPGQEHGAMSVYPLTYTLDPEEVQDAIDLKVERLHKMEAYAVKRHWPRRAHGCEFFGKPCGFLDVCHRRDEEFLTRWFDFEVASGRFSQYKRVYEPVWTLEA